jgi:hypothetical protein
VKECGVPNEAAQEILTRAGALSREELSRLGNSAGVATGFVGIRPSWIEARNAAVDAGRTAGLGPSLEGITTRATDAVMAAAVAAAAARHRDPHRVHEAMRAYQASDGFRYPAERHREARQLRKLRRIGLGVGTEKRIGLTIDAVEAAAIAAITWQLARDSGSYTVDQRSLLIKPWSAVARVPRDLVE